MKQKFTKNFFYQFVYQVLIMALPMVTVPIVSKALGSQGVGIYNYVYSVVSYFVLVAGLGLATYGIREIAAVKGDLQQLSEKFWELVIFNVISTTLTISCYIVFIFFTHYSFYYLIMGSLLVAVYFDISWFFYGIEDLKSITLFTIFIKGITCVCIFKFIHTLDDLPLYFFIQGFSVLMTNSLLWFFVFRKIRFVKVSLKKSLKHVVPASIYFIGKSAVILYTTLNKTLLGVLGNPQMVGIYANSILLIGVCISLIGVVDTVLLPHMTNLYVQKKKQQMLQLLQKSISYQLYFSIPMMMGITAITPTFVPWFFGKDFLAANQIIPFLALTVVFQPLGTSISRQYLIPMNNMRSYNFSVIFTGCFSFLLNILLIPRIGLWGAVLSIVLSEMSVMLIRIYYLVKEEDFSFDYCTLIKLLCSGMLMLGLIQLVTVGFALTPCLTTTFFQVFVGCFSYMIFTTLLKCNLLFELFYEKAMS